jgi:hypothetical protein
MNFIIVYTFTEITVYKNKYCIFSRQVSVYKNEYSYIYIYIFGGVPTYMMHENVSNVRQ